MKYEVLHVANQAISKNLLIHKCLVINISGQQKILFRQEIVNLYRNKSNVISLIAEVFELNDFNTAVYTLSDILI